VGSGWSIEVDTRYLFPRQGDVLLLCSDGLTNAVDEQEIAEILMKSRDLDRAAEQLVATANDNGGPDNVTVALQRWA
jgi:protein phosphatase